MDDIFELTIAILVPLGICVVLPVLIVFFITRISTNSDNKRAEVLIKAIECNANIDADKLTEALSKSKKTPLEVLNLRLLRGCIFTLLGVAAAVTAAILGHNVPDMNSQYPVIMAAGFCLAIGISYLIVYFVSRKSVNSDNAN